MTWYLLLGCLSGFRLLAPDMDPDTLLRTVLVAHAFDSAMCYLIAHNNGYSKNLWTVLGFIFGVWTVAVLILLPRRRS